VTDIFISYKREERHRVLPLEQALEAQGFSVWWDPELPLGQSYAASISKELASAKAVIAVWTAQSVKSEWVQEEANQAKRRAVLVPVRLEEVEPPIGFGMLQAADLFDWTPGDRSHPQFVRLIERLRALTGRAPGRTETSPAPIPVMPPRGRRWPLAAIIFGAIAVLVAGGTYFLRDDLGSVVARLTGSAQGTTAHGDLRFTPQQGQRMVEIFAFSPDGKSALSVGIDGVIHLFDATTGDELDTFTGYSKKVLQAEFSKTSQYVTVGLADNSFSIVELATAAEKGRIATPEIVSAMALAPDDGSLAVLANSGTVRIYQIDGVLLTSFRPASDRAVHDLEWTKESDGLVIVGEQGMVEVWDPFKPAKVSDLMRHTGAVRAAAISRDGATLASAGDDGLVILWDAQSGSRRGKLNGLTDVPEDVAWSRDGQRLAVASARGGFVWDAVIGSMPKTIQAPYGGKVVTFTPDGGSIVLQGESGPEAFRIPP
jgi:hypothetical protein